MEKMTEKERKTLQELQAKYKRVQRQEEEFFKDADERREVLLNRWGIQDRMQEAASRVGTDPDTLYDWITSDRQIDYFRRAHQMSQED